MLAPETVSALCLGNVRYFFPNSEFKKERREGGRRKLLSSRKTLFFSTLATRQVTMGSLSEKPQTSAQLPCPPPPGGGEGGEPRDAAEVQVGSEAAEFNPGATRRTRGLLRPPWAGRAWRESWPGFLPPPARPAPDCAHDGGRGGKQQFGLKLQP
jgi:hypothetical protein